MTTEVGNGASPAEVCLNFSLFFFLHFQGLKSRPRVANLLLLRMGGVWVPGTRDSERIAASLSTSSAEKAGQGKFNLYSPIQVQGDSKCFRTAKGFVGTRLPSLQ